MEVKKNSYYFFSNRGYIGFILLLMVVLGVILAGGVTHIGNTETPIFGYLNNVSPSPGTKESLQLKTIDILTITPTPATNGFASCQDGIQGQECGILYSYAVENGDLKLFYDDESAMPLGNVAMASSCPAQITSPNVNSNNKDANGFPYYPAVFVTDLTQNPNPPYSGDGQNGGTPNPPDIVYGAWKQENQGNDPNQCNNSKGNGTNLDGSPDQYPISPVPISCSDQDRDTSWTAENVWHIANLKEKDGTPLIPGHVYRFQFAMHDGDGAFHGDDFSDGCITFQN